MLSDDITEIVRASYEFNIAPSKIKGSIDEAAPFFSVSADNIIIDTIKYAGDGSGDIIVRMYECSNSMTNFELCTRLDVKKAYITNMLENNKNEIEIKDGKTNLSLHGCGVLTLRFVR